MRVALELEFPDEQAASVMRKLQDLPEMTIRFLKTDALEQRNPLAVQHFIGKAPLSEQEQNELLDKVFGSWQQEEGEEDLMSQIYGSRCDAPREVNL
jgi:hypothetical protein